MGKLGRTRPGKRHRRLDGAARMARGVGQNWDMQGRASGKGEAEGQDGGAETPAPSGGGNGGRAAGGGAG